MFELKYAGKPVSSLWAVIILLLAGWLIFNFVQTVLLVVGDYSLLPLTDYWRIPQFWANFHASHLSTLWVQHNEHRIVFPELIYVADIFLFQGRMYLPIALSGLCYLGVWILLVWAAYSTSLKSPIREIALLIAGVVIAWQGCSSVIATPFQLQFTMLQFVSAAAFILLAELTETNRTIYLCGTIAAGIVVNYSSANGMLLWPVLIIAGLLLRLPRQRVLVLTGSAVFSLGVYFIHYRFLPSQIGSNIKHPLLGAEFLSSYMGMPFGSFFAPWFGILVGAISLISMSCCTLVAWRRGLVNSRLGLLVFGLYWFTVLSALLTMLGRMDLGDSAFLQAKAARYVTMPTVGWSLAVIALVWITDEAASRTWSLILAFLICGFFGYGFVKARRWVTDTRQDFQNTQLTAMMLQNGVFDPDQVRTVFPDPEFVRSVSKDLRQNHKSIYALGDDKWIGGYLSHLHPSNYPGAGAVTHVIPVIGGLELIGWADGQAITRDHAVLFVDGNNTIVGFGRRPSAGVPAALSGWDTPNSKTWVGFVSLQKPVGKLTAYVRSPNGKTFEPLAGAINIPAFTVAESRSDSSSMAGINWRRDANWSLNGYPLLNDNGPAPHSAIYGSFGGPNTNTGAIVSDPFPTPSNHCLILPILHGTSPYKQSVRVMDADTHCPIAELPMRGFRSIWQWWRIPIPPNTHEVSIEASDQGSGPDQWVAIATPQVCP